MCELRFSKQQIKEKIQQQLAQNKYSKSDLIEQVITLLPSKSKDELIELLLDLANKEELEELMERVKSVDVVYKIY